MNTAYLATTAIPSETPNDLLHLPRVAGSGASLS